MTKKMRITLLLILIGIVAFSGCLDNCPEYSHNSNIDITGILLGQNPRGDQFVKAEFNVSNIGNSTLENIHINCFEICQLHQAGTECVKSSSNNLTIVRLLPGEYEILTSPDIDAGFTRRIGLDANTYRVISKLCITYEEK